jgi:hypothetical protein
MKNNSATQKAVEIEKTVHTELKVIEFTNSRGITMDLMGLPPYLIQMATESIKRPIPPTYTVKRADGGEDEFPHSQETIDDPKTSKKEKEKWSSYLAEMKMADAQASEVLLNVILVEGIKLHTEPDEMVNWEKRMKMMKISIPEDDMEKELVYKKEYAFSTQDDVEILMTKVLELTGVSRSEVDLAKSSFPNKVESEA